MNQRIKEMWVKDLRENGDKQGYSSLTRLTSEGEKDCCLGRLCKLAIKDGVQLNVITDKFFKGVIKYAESSSILPIRVQEWAELNSGNPKISNGEYLAQLNDEGKTFAEIADIIEKEF